jgi:hypothetical protein
MSYAFVFRAYPDVDHMVPLAWRLLEQGEEVHGIVSPRYDAHRDYRLRFLGSYPRFYLHEVCPADRGRGPRRALGVARSVARRSLPWAATLVARHGVRVIAVEWGCGLPDGYDRLGSPIGIVAVARSLAGSVRRIRDPYQVRMNFMVAARLLGRSTICLPHGLNIKLGRGNGEQPLRTDRWDFSDRNRFTVYVQNTAELQHFLVQRAGCDPSVCQTWGSLRWAPEWFEHNRALAPAFSWPESDSEGESVKVIFMVPKWGNRVDREATLGLVRRLSRQRGISLAIKGHPRPEDGSADPLRDDSEIVWTRVHDITEVDSVSAIAASDVVVDAGSSIGIEVVMQGKVLINPRFLHDFWTLFDDVAGSCVVANGADDVIAYLLAHAAGNRHVVTEPAYRELLRRGVYGSRTEPFDVLDAYCHRVRELAGQSNHKELDHAPCLHRV